MTEETIHPVDRHVGARPRTARLAAGMSQTVLAEHGGITFQQLQKYEGGRNRVSASMLWDLGAALKLPPAYFFEGLPQDVKAEPPGAATVREFSTTQAAQNLLTVGAAIDPPVLAAFIDLMVMHLGAVTAAGVDALEQAAA